LDVPIIARVFGVYWRKADRETNPLPEYFLPVVSRQSR